MKKSEQVLVYNKPNLNLKSIELYVTMNKINCRLLMHLVINTVDGDVFEHTILFNSLRNNGYQDLKVLKHFNPYLTTADYKEIKQNILKAYKEMNI